MRTATKVKDVYLAAKALPKRPFSRRYDQATESSRSLTLTARKVSSQPEWESGLLLMVRVLVANWWCLLLGAINRCGKFCICRSITMTIMTQQDNAMGLFNLRQSVSWGSLTGADESEGVWDRWHSLCHLTDLLKLQTNNVPFDVCVGSL